MHSLSECTASALNVSGVTGEGPEHMATLVL